MKIGERIKARRKELGMTQQELAEKLGYSGKTAICKIESGERELRQSKIKLVADALETTVDYIMGWTEEKPETIKPLDPDEESLLSVLRQLSKEDRDEIMFQAEHLRDKRLKS